MQMVFEPAPSRAAVDEEPVLQQEPTPLTVNADKLQTVDAALFGHLEESETDIPTDHSSHNSALASTALHLEHFDRMPNTSSSSHEFPSHLSARLQRVDSAGSEDVATPVVSRQQRASPDADLYMTAGVCNTPSRGSMDSMDSCDSLEAVTLARSKLFDSDRRTDEPLLRISSSMSEEGVHIGLAELDALAARATRSNEVSKLPEVRAESDLELKVLPEEDSPADLSV